MDIYEGERHFYRLDAHHVTTFRQAWDEENPFPLCKVTRRTFAINLTKFFASQETVTDTQIAKLSGGDLQRTLMPALKDIVVIRQACEILGTRQADSPETAAIVFVGNDEQNDRELDRHAVEVQKALERLNPQISVVKATSSDGDKAIEKINAFSRGEGDVLIVKQMASVGLDIPRLKISLDLSNIRTPAAFVQRMTRICTIWKRSSNPDDDVRTAVFICPDDIRGDALFQRFIIDEGGEASTSDLVLVETVKPNNNDKPEQPIYLAQKVSLPEKYGDTDQKEAQGTTLPGVEQLLEVLPELSRTRTHPDLAKVMESAGIRIAIGPPPVRDLNQEEEEEITRVRDIANKIINRDVKQELGRPYRQSDPESGRVYGRSSKIVWNRHNKVLGVPLGTDVRDTGRGNQVLGVPLGTDVRDIHDLPTLQKMRLNMEKEYHESLSIN